MLVWGTGLLTLSLISALSAFSGLAEPLAGVASIVFGLSLAAFVALAIIDTGPRGTRPIA